MSTYYVDNASSGSQYYFNNASTTSSQTQRTYTSSPGLSSSSYPTHISGTRSPIQQIRLDDSYHLPQHYQSIGGFNKNISQQRYQTPQSPAPQVRASVRVVGSQDQYSLPQTPSQPTQISPQQHHFQFDTRQQPGRSTGPAVVYQTPGAAQYTHHNVDLWTENPGQPASNQDHYVQAQRVSVRSVSTGSPHHSQSVSPQRPQDHLQQYYSQLTPEQHQQLLRQQQLQRQQEQTSHHDQQQRVTVQQVSPSSTYQHEQHRSTAGFATGGPQYQQVRGRSDSERHRQDEQDYYAAQRHTTAQRVQQDEEESQPVGIRNLLSKFGGNAPVQNVHPRSKSSNATRQYSTSSYTNNSGPSQRTTTRSFASHSMTYSALPKSYEPPVNSLEYYQMQLQQQGAMPFTNIQQAAAPSHIQHAPPTPTGFNAVRDRFKTGSLSEDYYRQAPVSQQYQPPPPQQYQPPPPQQQQQQQQQFNAGGSSLSSLRNQYMSQAKAAIQNELPEQPAQPISRTIIGEDIPQPKKQQVSQPPPPQQQQQQQSAPAPQPEQPASNQEESVEQQAPPVSEVASSPPTEETAAAAAGSS